MDGRENSLLVVRCGNRGEESIDVGALKLAAYLNSIKVRALHHYSTTLVCQFSDNMSAAYEHQRAESWAGEMLSCLRRLWKLNRSATLWHKPTKRSITGVWPGVGVQ